MILKLEETQAQAQQAVFEALSRSLQLEDFASWNADRDVQNARLNQCEALLKNSQVSRESKRQLLAFLEVLRSDERLRHCRDRITGIFDSWSEALL